MRLLRARSRKNRNVSRPTGEVIDDLAGDFLLAMTQHPSVSVSGNLAYTIPFPRQFVYPRETERLQHPLPQVPPPPVFSEKRLQAIEKKGVECRKERKERRRGRKLLCSRDLAAEPISLAERLTENPRRTSTPPPPVFS